MTHALLQRCACGGTPGPDGECAACKAKRLQRRAAGLAPPVAPPIVQRTLSAPGRPLEGRTRAAMEGRFRHDFGSVRVHADSASGDSARAVGALAYTVGSDIVFGAGRYAPETSAGRHLLAHELAHVVQQDGAQAAGGPPELDSDAPDSAELEARTAADAAVADRPARLATTNRKLRRRLQRSVGSPAGGCGVCFGAPNLVGIEAHKLIEAAMRAQYGNLLSTEFLIPSATDENGRLDLMVPFLDGFAIGEIKPANLAGQLTGDLDLFWYEDQLTAFGFKVTRLILPPPLLGIPFVDPLAINCPTQQLYVYPPVQGIYHYYCEPDFAVLRRQCRCRNQPRRVPRPVPVPVPAPSPVGSPRTAPETVPVPGPGLVPEPVGGPVFPPIFTPPPRHVRDLIRDFIRKVVELGLDAEAAARQFLEENAEVLAFLGAIALVVGAVAIVIGTLAEDVGTGGVGILDDPASFSAAAALLAAAAAMTAGGGGGTGTVSPEML